MISLSANPGLTILVTANGILQTAFKAAELFFSTTSICDAIYADICVIFPDSLQSDTKCTR